VKVSRFNPARNLILVRGRIWGRKGQLESLQLALDTGASETIVAPDVLDRIGYSPREGEAITGIRSAVGSKPGYLIRVARFSCLGFESSDFRIHAHDLPEGLGIDGLIGLSFLRQFNYEISSQEGRIRVERIATS
jgi:predicted aspartyl protease